MADEQVDYVGGQWVLEELLWPLGDHLGTVRDLAVFDEGSPDPGDEVTWIAEHRVYDAFGKLTDETEYDSSGTPLPETDAVDHIFHFSGRLNEGRHVTICPVLESGSPPPSLSQVVLWQILGFPTRDD